MEGSCEHGDEISGSIICWEVLERKPKAKEQMRKIKKGRKIKQRRKK
jgi:hypothetical protein